MKKRWNIIEGNEEGALRLQQELKIHPVLCRILNQRGLDTYGKAKTFFRPALEDLHDPWLMKDMDLAVARILNAIRIAEKILVFGDYDVDGTTSVACMYRFLSKIAPLNTIDYYIPHRYREGYGVSKAGIDFAAANGFTLVISLDCGIKSVGLISYAKELGIDFIICDHHTPDPKLPEAVAILNPKQADCNYPFKELCGCGVGFKLITALAKEIGLEEETIYDYLDLVATAIAADVVPLMGENRVLAYFGLKKANENPNFGIMALKELSGFDKELFITNLVFLIAPRVNAAGRMDDGKKAVQLFIASELHEAKSYAEMLHTDNTERKEADKYITEQALAMILEDTSMVAMKSTVVYQSHWHKGVVGIVASRLIDHYYRPTIVLTRSGEYAAGSARSVAGFNVYEALQQCEDLLLGYGGHFYAAGMTLEIDKIDAFRTRFEEVVSASITAEMLVPEIVIDAEVKLKDLTKQFHSIICQMEPFGPENMRPVFLARNVMDTGYSRIVKDAHIRFSIKQDEYIFDGIGFGMADKFSLLQLNHPIDIVFTLEENEWNNEKKLQLKIIDFRLS
ncbi:single-stranded-DNA-specific exonuclease RecJ [Flavitalea sp.]|nr:single-stranded-DNA-specific exonuclease RecJ [Flavitalea sp.]